jgi:hypothetical protein
MMFRFTAALAFICGATVASLAAQEAGEFLKLEPGLKFLRTRNARVYAITTPNGIDEANYVKSPPYKHLYMRGASCRYRSGTQDKRTGLLFAVPLVPAGRYSFHSVAYGSESNKRLPTCTPWIAIGRIRRKPRPVGLDQPRRFCSPGRARVGLARRSGDRDGGEMAFALGCEQSPVLTPTRAPLNQAEREKPAKTGRPARGRLAGPTNRGGSS